MIRSLTLAKIAILLALACRSVAQDDNRFIGHISFSRIKGSAVALHPEAKFEVNGFDNGDMSIYVLDTKVFVTIENFPAHNKTAVTALVFSPDGKSVASAGKDGQVMLWSTAALVDFQLKCQAAAEKNGEKPPFPKARATFAAHAGAVNALAWCPDGKRLATGGADGAVKLWDAATNKPLKTMPAHRGGVLALAFSLDAEFLASGGADKTAKIWQAAAKNELVRTLAHPDGPVLSVAFAPDDKQLATASGVLKKSGQVRLWQAATGKEEHAFAKLSDAVTTLGFHPKLARLAAGGADKKIRVWNTETKKQIYTDEHAGPLIHLEFAANGLLLASVCPEEIKWWVGSPKGE